MTEIHHYMVYHRPSKTVSNKTNTLHSLFIPIQLKSFQSLQLQRYKTIKHHDKTIVLQR